MGVVLPTRCAGAWRGGAWWSGARRGGAGRHGARKGGTLAGVLREPSFCLQPSSTFPSVPRSVLARVALYQVRASVCIYKVSNLDKNIQFSYEALQVKTKHQIAFNNRLTLERLQPFSLNEDFTSDLLHLKTYIVTFELSPILVTKLNKMSQ